jgi:hypothetical protein
MSPYSNITCQIFLFIDLCLFDSFQTSQKRFSNRPSPSGQFSPIEVITLSPELLIQVFTFFGLFVLTFKNTNHSLLSLSLHSWFCVFVCSIFLFCSKEQKITPRSSLQPRRPGSTTNSDVPNNLRSPSAEVTQKYDLGTDVSDHEKETQHHHNHQRQQRSPDIGMKEGTDTDLEINSSPTNHETKVPSNISHSLTSNS